LRVQVQGPKLPMQPLAPLVYLTEQGNPKVVEAKDKDDADFHVNPELAAKGREVFAGAGCASCHQLNVGGKLLASKLSPPSLLKLKPDGGCLEPAQRKGVPHFTLSPAQRKPLSAAIRLAAANPLAPSPTWPPWGPAQRKQE